MQDELIQLETAKLAKAKGFDEFLVRYVYDTVGDLRPRGVISINSSLYDKSWGVNGYYPILAPTQALLQRWLREKHNNTISIYNNASGFLWSMMDTVGGTDRGWSDYDGPNDSGVWDTYELALEAALLEGLKRIKGGPDE